MAQNLFFRKESSICVGNGQLKLIFVGYGQLKLIFVGYGQLKLICVDYGQLNYTIVLDFCMWHI